MLGVRIVGYDEYRPFVVLPFTQRLRGWSISRATLIHRLLQICQDLWLLATIRLLLKLPGTIGGTSKASSSPYLMPTADPNPRVCS